MRKASRIATGTATVVLLAWLRISLSSATAFQCDGATIGMTDRRGARPLSDKTGHARPVPPGQWNRASQR